MNIYLALGRRVIVRELIVTWLVLTWGAIAFALMSIGLESAIGRSAAMAVALALVAPVATAIVLAFPLRPDESRIDGHRAARRVPDRATSHLGGLTGRQLAIYRFIHDTIRKRGHGPTVREIGRAFAIDSPGAVMAQLKPLQQKGLVHREPAAPRVILLPPQAPPGHSPGLSILGTIAANDLLEPVWETLQSDDDGAETEGDGEMVVLRASGPQVIGGHTLDGSYIIVRRQDRAVEGQVVAALDAAGCAFLGSYDRARNQVRVAQGGAGTATVLRESKLLGVVVGVVRVEPTPPASAPDPLGGARVPVGVVRRYPEPVEHA